LPSITPCQYIPPLVSVTATAISPAATYNAASVLFTLTPTPVLFSFSLEQMICYCICHLTNCRETTPRFAKAAIASGNGQWAPAKNGFMKIALDLNNSVSRRQWERVKKFLKPRERVIRDCEQDKRYCVSIMHYTLAIFEASKRARSNPIALAAAEKADVEVFGMSGEVHFSHPDNRILTGLVMECLQTPLPDITHALRMLSVWTSISVLPSLQIHTSNQSQSLQILAAKTRQSSTEHQTTPTTIAQGHDSPFPMEAEDGATTMEYPQRKRQRPLPQLQPCFEKVLNGAMHAKVMHLIPGEAPLISGEAPLMGTSSLLTKSSGSSTKNDTAQSSSQQQTIFSNIVQDSPLLIQTENGEKEPHVYVHIVSLFQSH
jgi:hypothetical protein